MEQHKRGGHTQAKLLLQVAKVSFPVLFCPRLPVGPQSSGPGCVTTKRELTLAQPEGPIYRLAHTSSPALSL